MDEEIYFCPHCGKNLPVGSPYCPACGARLNDPQADVREKAIIEEKSRDRITIAVILLSVSAVITIVMGLYYIASAESMVDTIMDAYGSLLTDYYTAESLTSFIKMLGWIVIGIGALFAVTALLAFMRKFWILTVILCLIAALFGVLGLISLVLGLIAFYFIYKSKPYFTN
ncbi:MAG: zinc ribbon domain-containing protein [Methanomassiliicoccaceae archaeon]|nr:zinc ribbon domain-containing protein [Methanomassiliicoccaceae archaeon]